MKEGKPKFENKGLVAVLCVLLVVAVGLCVGIGVVSNNKKEHNEVINQQTEQEGDSADYQVEFLGEDESEDLPGTGYIGEGEV